jgi:hypothetical protein
MFKMKKLKGANMDIDLNPEGEINWEQDKCPWGLEEGKVHKCAEKNVCVCDYFQGIEDPDIVLCSYSKKEERD